MSHATSLRWWVGLLLSVIMTILPFPDPIKRYMPLWILLYLLCVQFYMPQYLSVFRLFLLGLMLDVLLYTSLGEHAFALLITVWFASRKKRQFVFFTLSQQMLVIFFFCLQYQIVIFLFNSMQGHSSSWVELGIRSLVSLLIWPGFRFLVRDLWFNQSDHFPSIL